MGGLRHGAQPPGGYPATPGGGFGTDTATMDSAAGYARHIGDVMKGIVNKLFNDLAPLSTQWKSPSASSAFQNAQNNWNTQYFSDLMRAINEIADGLDNSSKIYNQAETDSAGGIPTY